MFKPVNVVAIDIKKEPGVAHVGTYVGHTNVDTPLGPQIIWNFIDETELPFSVYGFTNMNRSMNALKEGSLCRLTYTGKKNVKTKFGMKDVHQVVVECDDGDPGTAPAAHALPGD